MATDIQAIKDRIDIVQLIGEYLPMKKAGANWKANCPFHHEKSPSFMVHQEKQIWHCFGCGKGGDIFSFVQEIESLEFIEALKLLAKRAGVEVTMDRRSESNQSLRNRLLEINSAAAYFFHHVLLELPGAENARHYLDQRQLKKQTILDWQVGYAPDQWELLTKYLLKKGFGIDDLVASGLTIKRDGADARTGRGFYDRFRGRIMFPICDPHSNVVGFTGRILVETENSGGKYVNTPETLLYEKSRILYGIQRAKTEIKSKDLAVLVEGQMDVIACHQAGMTNVVAASGTALTYEQIKLLKRYTNNIAMAFDADSAGERAGKRGIQIAIAEDMKVKVIVIPSGAGKDADECLKKNPAVWFGAVEKAQNIMDWYFNITLRGINKSDINAKKRASEILLDEISRIPNGVERDEWLKRLSEELQVDLGVLREEIKKIKHKPLVTGKVPDKNHPLPAKIAVPPQLEVLSDELWALLLRNPAHYGKFYQFLKKPYFEGTRCLALYEISEDIYNKKNTLDIIELRNRIPQNGGIHPIDILMLRPEQEISGKAEIEKEIENIIRRLKEKWRETRGKEIQRSIAAAERTGDKTLVNQLMAELQIL